MKKIKLVLYPTLALAIFAGVNLLIPSVSSQEQMYNCEYYEGLYYCSPSEPGEYYCLGELRDGNYTCEKGDIVINSCSEYDTGYRCNPKYRCEPDDGEYYFCTMSIGGEYYCHSGDGGEECYKDGGGEGRQGCYADSVGGLYGYTYSCHADVETRYSRTTIEDGGGYFFTESEDGLYFCGSEDGYDLGEYSVSDLNTFDHTPGYDYCYGGDEEYPFCNNEGDGYFCPVLYNCSENSDGHSCNQTIGGRWYCDLPSNIPGYNDPGYDDPVYNTLSSVIFGNDDEEYVCVDTMGSSNYDNCSPVYVRGNATEYDCPFKKYSCNKEEDGMYHCEEDEVAGDFYCEYNDFGEGVAKTFNIEGGYSCYQPTDNGKVYDYCGYDDEADEYVCLATYSCQQEVDGYNCIENPYGVYQCNAHGLIPTLLGSSTDGNYYCYDIFDNMYDSCYENDEGDGYFCPMKWGAKKVDGEYQCLANNAEYDEDLGQCVYKIETSDGNDMVIMSSNLGATEFNLMGNFYQWGNNYAYPRYPAEASYKLDCNLNDAGNGDCPLDGYETENENTDYYIMGHYDYFDEYGRSEGDKGPCPDGYHVPTLNEWTSLLVQWCENDNECNPRYNLGYDSVNGIDSWYLDDWYNGSEIGNLGTLDNTDSLVGKFMMAYGLYPAGLRNASTIYSVGQWGGHWSSSVVDESMGYSSYGVIDFGVEPGEGAGPQNRSRHGGLAVRCFSDATKNMGMPIALDLYTGGCSMAESLSVSECYHDFLGRKFVQPGQVVDATILNEAANLGNPGDGYQWVWYRDDDQSEKFNVNAPFQGDDERYELYAFKEVKPVVTHTITFNSDGGTPIDPITVTEGETINEPTPAPTKEGFTFAGWYIGNTNTKVRFPYPVQGDVTLKAHWTKNSSGNGGYSGGGGHSGGSSSDTHNSADDKSDVNDKPADNKPVVNPQSTGDSKDATSLPKDETQPKDTTKQEGGRNGGSNTPTNGKEYTKEVSDAYKWAYANGLTKYANIGDARMEDPLNRQEMAKISTLFATEFENKAPNEKKREACSQYSDLWKVTSDMEKYIIQSCELGYMGYRANGVDYLERFRPYTPVSLAEFSIILSRIKWGNRYAVSETKWYQGHLYAVYENNLIDNISKPFENITRKDAYVMLYRLIESEKL